LEVKSPKNPKNRNDQKRQHIKSTKAIVKGPFQRERLFTVNQIALKQGPKKIIRQYFYASVFGELKMRT
jgi:hypothetical protein